MSWKSYFFPQTILITSSPNNHHIRVNEEWGKMKLLINGSPQSGSYIAYLWKHAFDHFNISFQNPRNALVLGIGGGTVMSLLSDYFPAISQTCVDIDSTIIHIAKKYFLLDEIPNISVIHADANTYVKQLILLGKTYDCIIIDLFVGGYVPSFVEEKRFIQTVDGLLSPKGFLCMNYLREREYKTKSVHLRGIFQSIFSKITEFEIARNRFFYIRK